MDHDSPSGAGPIARLSTFVRRHAAVMLVIVIGVSIGVGLFVHAYGGQRRHMIDDFRGYTAERVSVVDWHLRTHALALDSMRAFFDASNEVDRQEFHAFVQPLLKHHPEMISLGWAPRVPAAQLRKYEQYVRDEGIGEFCIISAERDQPQDDGPRPKVYFPTHYLEPQHSGMIPLGHDLASSPAVARALRWSRDTNNMVTIGPVVLGHPDGQESGTIVALPIYWSGPSTESVEDRRADLAGYVFQAYALEDVIARAVGLLPAEGIDFAVFALFEPGEEQLVAFHSSRLRRTPVAFVASEWTDRRGDLREVVDLPIPGGELLVVARPTPGFIAARTNWHPWMLLVITLALTGLMVTYIHMVRTRRERVESLAAELAETNESLLKEIDYRRRAEQAVRQQQENLQIIFDASPVGMVLMDETMVIRKLNDVAARLVDKESPAMLDVPPGKALGCIHAAEVPEGCGNGPSCPLCPLRSVFQSALDSDEPVLGVEVQPMLMVGGRMVQPWLEIGAAPMLIDGRRHVIASISNITDRKLAEEELHKRTYDLGERVKELKCLYSISALMEQPDISLAEIAQGVVDLIPPSWQYPEITCARVVLNDQEYKTDGFAESPWGQTCEIVAHGETLGSVAVYYLEERPECYEGPFFKEERDLIAAVAERLGRFTERKQAQGQLERAKDAAEAANRAKTFFLANMSHEIRTPLTGILGFAEMLTDTDSPPDEQREWMDAISRNAKHLLLLINDVLDVAKIEADKLSLTSSKGSLVSAIGDVVSMLRTRAQQQGLSLSIEYRSPLPATITIDHPRLRQVLVNLVGNAIKFTEHGGVTVAATFLPDWRNGGPAVRIDVIDTGVGIDAASLEHLFDPFYQADASTSRKRGGTGLGLAITHRIVEMMGGTITVQTAPNEGSTFSITLPTGSLEGVAMLSKPDESVAQDDAAKDPSADAQRLDDVHILVAEDGPDNQRLISALLERAGANVTVVANGRLAVERAMAEPFDLVLMDMQMPEMDGYQATRLLRQGAYAGPILALTAHAMSGDRDECLSAGCTDYLTKPIDRNSLISAVAAHASRAGDAAGLTDAVDSADASQQHAMSTFADDEGLTEVIGNFVAGLPDRMQAMRQALDAGLFPQLERLAHQLKGGGGSYGYPRITEVARQVENAARAGDSEEANLAVGRMQRFCGAVVAAWQARRLSEGASL